jgi:hypothetical protein
VEVAITHAGGQGLMFLVHDYCWCRRGMHPKPIEDSGIGVAMEGKLEPSLVGFQRTQRRPS